MTTLLTQAAFARDQGWSRAYVSKLIKQGRIQLVNGKVDPQAALKALASTADPARQSSTSGSGGIDYAKAKTMNEAYKARLTKLKYEEKSQELLPADQVYQDAYKSGRLVRDALLAIPERVGALLAAETDEAAVKDRLIEEIETVLTHLVNEFN